MEEQVNWIDVTEKLPPAWERVFVLAEDRCPRIEDPLGMSTILMPFLAEFSPCTGWRLISHEKLSAPVRYWASISIPEIDRED